MRRMNLIVKQVIDRKWEAQDGIESLRREIGGIVT